MVANFLNLDLNLMLNHLAALEALIEPSPKKFNLKNHSLDNSKRERISEDLNLNLDKINNQKKKKKKKSRVVF